MKSPMLVSLGLGTALLLLLRKKTAAEPVPIATPIAPTPKPSTSSSTASTPKPSTPKPSAPVSTSQPDSYCTWLLSGDDLNLLFDYAKSSNSTQCLEAAASRLASAGDTRAITLTQRLADLRKGVF